MNRMTRLSGAAVLGLAAARASAADSIGGALEGSRGLLDWRLRQETVEQEGFAHDADALTSRLRAGFETAPLAGTSLLAEAVWVADLSDDYNSTTNGNSAYPVVADPSGFAAINRFAVKNESFANTTFTIGRQRIIHDDARFVGNVGWRQNEQTYDAVRMQYSGAGFEGELTYAGQVNRIFGPDSAAGEWSGDIVMARASWPLEAGRITGFHYLVEIDEAAAVASQTTGVRFAGIQPLGAFELGYTLSLARQSDAGANPVEYDETYFLGELGFELEKLSGGVGYELLGGDGVASVTTPLATLHAFQGWADRFLATPASGLEDRFLRLGYAFGAAGPFRELRLAAALHSFRSDTGSTDFGNETDLSVVARTERLALTLKYASYSADAPLADTDKAWASLEYAW